VIRKIVIAVGSVLAIQAVGAFLFAWSGLYSVAASDRHWPITYWFLVFGLRNSIETHSIGIEVPPLDDMSLVYRGIGHYRGGCEPCHGAPGSSPNPITQQMLPEPPYMPDVVHDWEPQHLFWIVRNGLKYSGMPGWVPPERADEVWAVVAALLRLPEMSPEEYQKLSGGEVASRSDIVGETAELIGIAGPVGNDLLACGRCHGLKGTGGGAGGFPRLAGQKQDYLYETMKSYAIGNRPSGMMQPVAVEPKLSRRRTTALTVPNWSNRAAPSSNTAFPDRTCRPAPPATASMAWRRTSPATIHGWPGNMPVISNNSLPCGTRAGAATVPMPASCPPRPAD
jgi:hypothetical protein